MSLLRRLRANRERGQALVEFSMVAIVFFALVLGMFEVGRAVWHYNTISQATREGARYAVVHGARCDADPACAVTNEAEIEQIVKNHAPKIDPAKVSVDVEWICRLATGTCNDVWDHVEVTTQYDYTPAAFLSELLSLPSVTITSSSTMEMHY